MPHDPSRPLTRVEGRLEALDRARGLGILAIVAGHFYLSEAPVALIPFLYAFHVPLFFFLSGLLFRAPESNVLAFIRRRLTRIVIPYAVWAVVSITVYLAVGSVVTDALSRGRRMGGPGHYLLAALYANPTGGGMAWNRPLWFLAALAVTYLVVTALLVALRPLGQAAVPVAFGLSAVTSAWMMTQQMTLPWSAERALVLLPFFVAGVMCRPWVRLLEHVTGLRVVGALGVAVLCFGGVWYIAAHNGVVEYIMKAYGDSHAYFALAAVLGILGTLALACAVPSELLSRAGRDSLPILLTHKFVIVVLQLLGLRLGLAGRVDANLLMVGAAVVTVGICLAARPALQWIWPQAIGRTARRESDLTTG